MAELEIVFAGTRIRLASAAQRVQTLVKKIADRNQHLALALLNVERYDLVGEFFESRIAAQSSASGRDGTATSAEITLIGKNFFMRRAGRSHDEN